MLLHGDLDCAKLFSLIIRSIGSGLPSVILNGMMGDKLERKVLSSCVAYLTTLQRTLRYQTVTAGDLDTYWTTIQTHYQTHGAGSVLFSVSGSHDHWTCAHRITRRCIFLTDSGEWKQRLYRSRITIGSPCRNLHALLPSETYLLMVDLA